MHDAPAPSARPTEEADAGDAGAGAGEGTDEEPDAEVSKGDQRRCPAGSVPRSGRAAGVVCARRRSTGGSVDVDVFPAALV